MCVFELWFSPDICPGVGLLAHMVVLFSLFFFWNSLAFFFFSLFKVTSILFFIVTYQFTFLPTVHEDSFFSTPSLPGANTWDPTPKKAIGDKTWWARRIRFSGVFEKASSRDPTQDKVTRRKPDREGRSGFQGFQNAAPGSHLKDDICLSYDFLNGLWHRQEGLPWSLPK